MIAKASMPHIRIRHCGPTGRRNAPPDDRLREAIQSRAWLLDCFVALLLAMTRKAMARGQHDRVSDSTLIGGPGRDVGGTFVSAEIIRFIPRPDHHREQTELPTVVSRSAARPDDLTMDHVDTSPCEYGGPDEFDSGPRSPDLFNNEGRTFATDRKSKRLNSSH